MMPCRDNVEAELITVRGDVLTRADFQTLEECLRFLPSVLMIFAYSKIHIDLGWSSVHVWIDVIVENFFLPDIFFLDANWC